MYCWLKRFIFKFLSISFKTSSLFWQPRLTRNIICLPFFCNQIRSLKNSFLSLPARPVRKITCDVPSQTTGKITPYVPAQPARWKNHPSFAGPPWPVGKTTTHLPAHGPGRVRALGQDRACRPLLQTCSLTPPNKRNSIKLNFFQFLLH